MELIDSVGTLRWRETPATRHLCEAQGTDAGSVLTGLVAQDGGVQLGISASYTDGQAVTVARNGGFVYALRAIPHPE